MLIDLVIWLFNWLSILGLNPRTRNYVELFQGDCNENACNPNPCENGGGCALQGNLNNYVCHCEDGYTGQHCEDGGEDGKPNFLCCF